MYFLDFQNDQNGGKDETYDEDQNNSWDPYPISETFSKPTVYGRVIDIGENKYLQYYFFYFINEWNGNGAPGASGYHEGDWEFFTVELNKDNKPKRVAGSIHVKGASSNCTSELGGLTLPWSSVETETTHPRIFVGRGGHPTYLYPGVSKYIYSKIIASGTGPGVDYHNHVNIDKGDIRYVEGESYKISPIDRYANPDVYQWLLGNVVWGHIPGTDNKELIEPSVKSPLALSRWGSRDLSSFIFKGEDSDDGRWEHTDEWMNEREITQCSTVPNLDSDSDGIPALGEMLVPDANDEYMGDGNGDGIPDMQQPYVTSMRTYDGSHFVTITNEILVPLGTITPVYRHFPQIRVVSHPPPSNHPSSISFPYGTFEFEVKVGAIGSKLDVFIYIPKNPRINGYYKKNLSGEWVDVARKISHTKNKTIIKISLEDGDEFDSDGVVNGFIRDPGGPVIGTPDPDGDGVPGARDNCPTASNPDQSDADGDGIGDVCDETPSSNRAPKFSVGPDQTIDEDAGRIQIPGWATNVTDGDDGTQSLYFEVVGNSNPGLFLEQPWVSYPSRTLRYQARENAYGEATITLVLKDDGGTASGGVDTSEAQSFKITVLPVNDVPTIGGNPSTRVDEGSPYYFAPSASDVDGDTLAFSIANKPSWANFDSATGVLSGRPGQNDVGHYKGVQISVSDGNGGSASLPPFTITVGNVNEPPVISGSPPDSVDQGTFYYFAPRASDPDGDKLSFSIVNKPSWLSFDSATGVLQGTPETEDVGLFENILMMVTDGHGGHATLAFSIRVLAKADVYLTLDADRQILEIDDAALITATIQNNGAAAATNVYVNLQIKGQSMLDITDPRCTMDTEVTCWIGDLPPGSTEIRFRFSRDTAGDLFVLGELSYDNDAGTHDHAVNLGLVVGKDASVTPGIALSKGVSRAVATGDLNGDGYDDIVLANGAGTATQLLFGSKSGKFSSSASLPDIEADSYDVALVDIDRDGDLDIVLANASLQPQATLNTEEPIGQANHVWLNNGLGEFELLQSLGSSDSYGMAAGDIDSDGDQDLVFANRGQNTVYLNNGAGHFELDNTRQPGYGNSQAVALADINQDGVLDAVVANLDEANELYLDLAGDPIVIPDWAESLAVAVADLDNDGALEMVFANGGMGKTDPGNTIYRYDLDKKSIRRLTTIGKQQSRNVLIIDAEGDGVSDLLFINRHGGHQIYLGSGPVDRFILGEDLIVLPYGSGASSLQITDDTLADLVIANDAKNSVSKAYINRGKGNFRTRGLSEDEESENEGNGTGAFGLLVLVLWLVAWQYRFFRSRSIRH